MFRISDLRIFCSHCAFSYYDCQSRNLGMRCVYCRPILLRLMMNIQSYSWTFEIQTWWHNIWNKVADFSSCFCSSSLIATAKELLKLAHIWQSTKVLWIRNCSDYDTRADAEAIGGRTLWPPSWKHDGTSEIWLCQLMCVCVRNNPAKFHFDPIWNAGALDLYEELRPNKIKNKKKKKNKMSSNMRWVLGLKNKSHIT